MNRSRNLHGLAIKSARRPFHPIWAGLVIVLIGALFAGCSADLVGNTPKPAADSGTLVIDISSLAAKTLLPPIDMQPAGYRIRGSGPDGSSFLLDTTQTQAQKTDLALGSWTVTVEAMNANGELIGRGQGVIELTAGAVRTVSIRVTPIEGSGTLQLTARWTLSSVTSPSVTARLVPPGGTAIPLAFTLASGSATCTKTAIPTGYYSLEVQLLSGTTAIMGATDTVRIVADQTTSGTFNFTQQPGGSIQVTVSPDMADPIPVTLSGAQAEIAAGGSMTVTASVPASAGTVTYAWYVNGQAKGSGPTCTVGAGLAAGTYRLDANAFSADGTRAGSATHTFLVTGTTPPPTVSVTLAWDANTEPDLAGYRLYYGTASGSYPNRVDAGKQTTCTVDGLDPAKSYYFVVTAYNTSGQESGYSNETVLAPR